MLSLFCQKKVPRRRITRYWKYRVRGSRMNEQTCHLLTQTNDVPSLAHILFLQKRQWSKWFQEMQCLSTVPSVMCTDVGTRTPQWGPRRINAVTLSQHQNRSVVMLFFFHPHKRPRRIGVKTLWDELASSQKRPSHYRPRNQHFWQLSAPRGWKVLSVLSVPSEHEEIPATQIGQGTTNP